MGFLRQMQHNAKRIGGNNVRQANLKKSTNQTRSIDEAGGVIGEFKGSIESAGPKFAFIACKALEKQGHGKVFVLRDQLKAYKVGQIVKFTAYLDGQGRCQGKALRSGLNKDTNTVEDEEGTVIGEFTGKIDKAGPKFAFINCTALKAQGHDDVFILKTELKNYQVGQIVKFSAFFDSQNRLQGRDLKSGLKSGTTGVKNLSKLAMSVSRRPVARKVLLARGEQGTLGEFRGKIESAGPKFAFIDCKALEKQGHGEKVFILRDQLKLYQVGQIVRFTAYLDEQGRLKGKDLRSGINDSIASRPIAALRASARPALRTLKVNVKRMAPKPRQQARGNVDVLGEFKGEIESAGPKYAFIDCTKLSNQGRGKVFILADQLKAYKVGQTVKFTAYLDSQGRLQGKDLKSGLK